MKNKTIIVAMALTLAATAASAYDEKQKIDCLANSGKVVWIESKGACIPLDPCDDPEFEVYCVRAFANIQVYDESLAKLLVERYLEANGIECVITKIKVTFVKQDFVYCEGTDNYLQFEFDDTDDISYDDSALDFQKGTCIALNGIPSDDWKAYTKLCKNISAYNCQRYFGGRSLEKVEDIYSTQEIITCIIEN